MNEEKKERYKLNNKGFEKPELIVIIAVLAIIILIGIIIGSLMGKRKPLNNGIVTISYNANGGTGEMNNSECRTGSNCILKNNMFKKEGYEFTGWSHSETENKEIYGINDTYKADSDATLYAQWKLKEITITYNANGGTGQMEPTKYTYGAEKVNISQNKFTKEGYTFSGWTIYNPTLDKWYGCTDDTTTCTGTEKNTTLGWHNRDKIKVYYNNKTNWDSKTTQQDIVCYAQWTKNVPKPENKPETKPQVEKIYQIKYQLNGGRNGKNAPVSGVEGSVLTISNPTKEGYQFTGWTLKGTGAKLNNGKLTIGTSDITLTANWNAKASDYIEYLYNDSTLRNNHSLKKDNTSDQNIRYYGKNPTNYVTFNNEVWRIIGLINVNGSKKIKLVRNDLLLNEASWDSSSSNINNGKGINEWTQADINKILNDYYAGNSNSCKYCNSKSQSSCKNDCSRKISKLSSSAKNMIEDAVWYLGGIQYGGDDGKDNTTILEAYQNERNSNTINNCIYPSDGNCTDNMSRSSTWTGKVGLISASDYGYASPSSTCNNDLTYNEKCASKNWLDLEQGFWTMTPRNSNYYGNAVWYATGYNLGDNVTSAAKGIRPAVYLKSNVKILSGDGSKSNPYKLGM